MAATDPPATIPDAEAEATAKAWAVDFTDDTVVPWADLDGAGKFLRVFLVSGLPAQLQSPRL